MRFSKDQLEGVATQILRAANADLSEARVVARHLVKANLMGHDSHGVIRLSQYVEHIREGAIHPGAELVTLRDAAAVTLFDGGRGFGQVMATKALAVGLEKARRFGIAMVGLRNVGHVGRLGDWADLCSEAGVVSQHFVNSPARPAMVPFGGRERRMSANPICVGVPESDGPGLSVDMTTSSVAEGKLRVARAAGKAIPPDWIVDRDGQATTDPADFYEGGAMLPMGKHKGYALGLVVELFAGALSLGETTDAQPTVNTNNMLSILIDPGAYEAADDSAGIASAFLDFVRSSRPADPSAPVQIPGEPEARTEQSRLREGIEIPEPIWAQIAATAATLGLSETELTGQDAADA